MIAETDSPERAKHLYDPQYLHALYPERAAHDDAVAQGTTSADMLDAAPHQPVYTAITGSAVSNMGGLPFNANHSIKISTIGAKEMTSGLASGVMADTNKSLNLSELRARIAQRMEYMKVDPIDPNDPAMKDPDVPSYRSSTTDENAEQEQNMSDGLDDPFLKV